MTQPKTVIVVGAGLAGLSCAVELLERGHRPVVLEARSYVGGRTASFEDNGLMIETGLHRYLGFYHHLPRLLRLSGLKLTDVVFWEDAVELRLPEGPQAVFHASVHRPWRSLRSLLGNRQYISWGDRWELTKLFSAGLYDYFWRSHQLKNITVADYARRHGVGDRAYQRVVRTLCEGIFFTPPEEYAAYNLFGLIGPYLPYMWKFRIGGFRGGMTHVMCQPIADSITARGGEVRVDAEVTDLILEHQRVAGVHLADGQELRAESVVLASSLGTTQRLLAKGFGGADWCKRLQRLKMVPVATLHLELSRPALPVDRTTFGPATPLSAFAEQSRTTFNHTQGRLSIILSPPSRYQNRSVEQISKEAVIQLQRLGVDIADTLRDARKVVLPQDFYSLDVGMDQLRPRQQTPVPGLALAGDYTSQKYLATMEGAVFSGRIAAKIVS
jgi:15-cis-phytoene desaturase